MAPSLSDLRNTFYGGASAAEYKFLKDAAAAGITGASLISGREYASAEIPGVDFNPGNGNQQDVPGLLIPVTPVATEVMFEINIGAVICSLANGTVAVYLVDDAAAIRGNVNITNAAGGGLNAVCLRKKITGLAVGVTRNWKVQVACPFGGNVRVNATGAYIASIRAERV